LTDSVATAARRLDALICRSAHFAGRHADGSREGVKAPRFRGIVPIYYEMHAARHVAQTAVLGILL